MSASYPLVYAFSSTIVSSSSGNVQYADNMPATWKMTGITSESGGFMFALVIFVCYLGHGCDELAIGAYNTEAQCLQAMDEQRLRRAGCYPIEEFIDGFWMPAQEYTDF